MSIHLDHFIVPSHNKAAAARRLAELLGVDWAETAAGPFSAVYINRDLTLDFVETEETFPVHHYCFRVSEEDFESILERIRGAGIPYRSAVHGPVDLRVNAQLGNVYWNEPEGHQWEMLTASYARPAQPEVEQEEDVWE